MIQEQLQGAKDTLDALISITKLDLDDIKLAKHEAVFSRSKEKEQLASLFETKKRSLDLVIAESAKNSPDTEISQLLSETEKTLLNGLKNSLIELHRLNKRFASLVIGVGEFYTSLLNAIFPSEKTGYGGAWRSNASLLKTRG